MNDINKLRPGEIHVAAIQIAGEAPYHLILLPDHPKNVMTHQRDQFASDWYWSNTLHESGSDYAWCQTFGYGGQGYYNRSRKLRARAVRREYF